MPGVAKLLDHWHPENFADELKYQRSLVEFFRERIPTDCRVEREYRHEGTTVDLYLCWSGFLSKGELFIEVKRNLNKKATLDRLVGQIETLTPGKRAIMVVLVGETNEALLGRLEERYKRLREVDFEERLAIVVKRPQAAQPSPASG